MRKSCKSDRRLQEIFKRCLQGIVLFLLFLCFQSCDLFTQKNKKEQAEIKKEIYYCPMHPDVQQDHPGTCPKPSCKGMKLIKKEPEDSLHAVLQSVNSSVLANVKTIHPEKKDLPVTIETRGYIDYDERTKHNIASRFDGRIEKLYVKYNYQPIRKGDKLFDIYSSELVTAEENLLFLLTTDKEAAELIEAAKQKLKILGLNDEQIRNLVISRRVQNSVSVYSKWDGHIHEMQNGGQNSNSNLGTGMTNETTNASMPGKGQTGDNSATIPLTIKEGMYVTRGQTIFNIVDAHSVVVMLQIKSQDISKVRVNQEVSLEIDESPKMVMEGRINFIEPILRTGYKTIFARIDVPNMEHKHKVGTLVKGTIKMQATKGLWLPASAVVDLGKNKIVWLKKEGHFVSRKIETGVITKDFIEVTEGIDASDEVAVEGHYLTDSEGFTKTNGE